MLIGPTGGWVRKQRATVIGVGWTSRCIGSVGVAPGCPASRLLAGAPGMAGSLPAGPGVVQSRYILCWEAYCRVAPHGGAEDHRQGPHSPAGEAHPLAGKGWDPLQPQTLELLRGVVMRQNNRTCYGEE